MKTRVCNRCKIEKILEGDNGESDFNRDASVVGGRKRICRCCTSAMEIRNRARKLREAKEQQELEGGPVRGLKGETKEERAQILKNYLVILEEKVAQEERLRRRYFSTRDEKDRTHVLKLLGWKEFSLPTACSRGPGLKAQITH